MKIELDHQELQTVLEHVRQTKSADTEIVQKIIEVAGPTITNKIFEHLAPRGPQIVPDQTGTDD